MYSKKLSIPSLIVVGLLVLYSVDQASALRCYACESTSAGSCWSGGSLAPSVVCSPVRSLDSTTADTTIQAAMSALNHQNGTSVDSTNYSGNDCARFVGTYQGYDYVVRMCTLEDIPCKVYADRAASIGFIVKSCTRCSQQLCN